MAKVRDRHWVVESLGHWSFDHFLRKVFSVTRSFDDLSESNFLQVETVQNSMGYVIPAKAGIQKSLISGTKILLNALVWRGRAGSCPA
ncbi:MAG TPA: hypothetical protein VHO84_04755 [Syntrophorhabdaceae bacterium]|nr:hypothetical protein [Syntrophorhabdaceae bacterium]